MDHRTLRALALASPLVLLTGCVGNRDDYPHVIEQEYSEPTSLGRTLLVLVVAPLVIAGVLTLLAWLPYARRRHRYRPSEGWDAEPVWFAGPPDPTAAVEQAQTGDVVRGGAGGSW